MLLLFFLVILLFKNDPQNVLQKLLSLNLQPQQAAVSPVEKIIVLFSITQAVVMFMKTTDMNSDSCLCVCVCDMGDMKKASF